MRRLRDYQLAGVAFLQSHARAALWLDMGLGKTAVALTALTLDHLPALVVAPKRIAEEVWPEEARTWRPGLRVASATGRPAARNAALAAGAAGEADLVVLGVDNLADALPHISGYSTVIIDEASKFKSHRSARFKVMRQLTTDHLWELSGTPSPNGLLDVWAPIYLLDRGARLGRNISAYRDRYFEVGKLRNGRPAIIPATGVVTSWVPKPGAAESIHRALEGLCLSMSTEGRVELPPVTVNEVTVPLSSTVMRHYRKLKRELVVDLDMLGNISHSAPNAAVMTAKLSQITSGFLYDYDELGQPTGTYTVLHRDKVNAVAEVVEGTGSPVLVFYRFKAELELLRETIKEAVHIDDPRDDGRSQVAAWNAGDVPVLLAHPASAGHGLNLQHGGHTVVWSSLPWSLEEWEQANKRLARSGQTHPVIIHTLVSPRTVDGEIIAALTDKKSVQDALLDHLESPL